MKASLSVSQPQSVTGIRKSRRGVYAACTAVISAAILFVAGETLVRLLLPFTNPDTVRKSSLQYVPSIFAQHRLRPSQVVEVHGDRTLWHPNGNDEPIRRYFINRMGYRGQDFIPSKPAGTIRIIILGGSSVFDPKVKDRSATETKDWPHLVERLLRQHGNVNVEVINAGIPGHASFDALGRLYSQLWMYQPDYVLYYGAWNDIKYFRKLTPETPLISVYPPLSNRFDPFTQYRGLWDRLLSNSQLYVTIRNKYYRWKIRTGGEGAIPEGKYEDAYRADAVRQYRLNLELIVDACRAIKAAPILLTEATLVSPNNSDEERKLIQHNYQLLTHRALVSAFEDTYEVVRTVAKEKSVPMLDLAKQLNGKSEFFTDAVHFTAKGSQEAANRVGEFMLAYLEETKLSHKLMSIARSVRSPLASQ